ncbi:hypothetical protein Leryth_027052 [Lithospermum erythrorhizon]|nr:hypothetical protein Leryth_027052 [Lithospermum erythrorhizon]
MCDVQRANNNIDISNSLRVHHFSRMNSDMESTSRRSIRKNHLSIDVKRHIFGQLLMMLNGKKLKHGSITKLAQTYSVSTKTISKIWSTVQLFIANEDTIDITNNLGKRVVENVLKLIIRR